MSAFTSAKMVEAKAMMILGPFIRERACDGQFVWNSKGPLAKSLQETVGDVFFNTDTDRIWAVEIKAERKHTGNLFLETWSNKNLRERQSHADRGSNPGWLYKLRADMLMYYFIDSDDLYVIDVYSLKRWAFCGGHNNAGNLWSYREVPQGTYEQLNDTYGRLVPIEDLKSADVGLKHFKPMMMLGHVMEEAQ